MNDPLPEPRANWGKATVYGVLVAVIGGSLWAALTIFAGVKIGILAWALGIAVGTTLFVIVGEGSLKLGLIATALTVLSLGVGKGLVDRFYTVPAYYAEFHDPSEALDALSKLELSKRLDLEKFDLLWVLLALGSAWRISRGRSGG